MSAKRLAVLLSTLAVMTVIGAGAASADEPGSGEALTRESLEQQVRLAVSRLDGLNPHSAHEPLQTVLNAPAFAGLAPHEQGQILTHAARAAIAVGDLDLARELGIRAAEVAPTNGYAWRVRTAMAVEAADWSDAARSLTQVLATAPSQLALVPEATLVRIVIQAGRAANEHELYVQLFDALAAAGAAPCSRDIWTDSDCGDIAALWLEHGEQQRAWLAASSVMNPYVLIAMRADRRFDTLRAAYPEHFDIDRAVERRLAQARAAIDEDPTQLDRYVSYGYALLDALQPENVGSVIRDGLNAHQRNARSVPFGSPIRYTSDQLPWLYDTRARAREALGRHRAARADLEHARSLTSGLSSGVNFDINLAAYLIRLEEPARALAILSGQPRASAYGRMLIARVRVEAAVLQNDATGAAQALDYLRENRDVHPQSLQSALVFAGEYDEAEQYFIHSLADPILRADALLSAQQFAHTSVRGVSSTTPIWEEFIARAAIQSAIERVGRIETYTLRRKSSR